HSRDSGESVRETVTSSGEEAFDLTEDLTPYELKTVCQTIDGLKGPSSFVEIFSRIRELEERGELELSQEEIGSVITALLDADYLNASREKPYEQSRAKMDFYSLNKNLKEVENLLDGS
ncbi:MAG: hypothetical protein L0G70_00845, partial [Rubrobacter sp.]|nr:hypothetical protein [Rubrobacter sp.]